MSSLSLSDRTFIEVLRMISSFLVAALFGMLFVAGLAVTGHGKEVSPSSGELTVTSRLEGVPAAQVYHSPGY